MSKWEGNNQSAILYWYMAKIHPKIPLKYNFLVYILTNITASVNWLMQEGFGHMLWTDSKKENILLTFM